MASAEALEDEVMKMKAKGQDEVTAKANSANAQAADATKKAQNDGKKVAVTVPRGRF